MFQELWAAIYKSIDFVLLILPFLLPIAFVYLVVTTWIDYKRKEFMNSQEYVLLEIVPPAEIFKSPAAMELFLTALHQTTGETTWIDRYWKGKVRAWFSLEIVSTDGNVNFYLWTRNSLRNYIESQLYAQFPGIEVLEAEDYSKKIEIESGKYSMFGLEYGLTAPDPYPIKTYVDYGLDKDPKEEYKIDPITATLEFFGSIRKGESAWMQIIVRAHKGEDKDPSKWFGKVDLWKKTAEDEIKKIREGEIQEVGDQKLPNKTKGQELKIAALERSISKLSFDVGIRTIYVAEKDLFQPVNIGGLVGAFKQYNSLDLNGFKPIMATGFDYPWQDPFGKKVKRIKKEILTAYKMRDYFWKADYKGRKRKKFVLNTEELATIYHFPGSVAGTPTLERVVSKKATPPPNLPS